MSASLKKHTFSLVIIQFSQQLHFHALSQYERILISCRMLCFLLILAKFPVLTRI